ncbi:glycoside hydrolase family 3 C-terminal domain-containing protein [Actinomadura xylanilytica]|uniref:glycoside hydrolase family 3 C-terminal domain-containing protein n=1 Tax=Actinomadura xylanilytica TaxID=887459 RepID=UPI00255A7FB9|nr:glycoside hydrolase family 3 C-terminal domain-containing protein [Actinomadura xylanilytica]MDL4772991.1 glycoside hydrolase family 3 C-terminal domain-containing protein [Actinomadura xylanilytica]
MRFPHRSLRVAALAAAIALTTSGTAVADRPPDSGRVRTLIGKMTLDEKLGFVSGTSDPRGLGEAGYIPGVPRLGIPELRLADGPAGVRVADHATAMPAPVALASTFDDRMAREFGRVIGRDGRALGQDVLLAPMVNTIRVPQAGRNFETFSEDPLLSSRTVAAEVRGIQSQGLIATVKHYAENNQETDRGTFSAGVNVNVDEQTLHEIELQGFQAAIDAGAGAVMCSYNQVNGAYACQNEQLLNAILKERWGFRGWVMSDWGANRGAEAITKGLDQEMPGDSYGPLFPAYFQAPLRAALVSGRIPMARLDRAVDRILGQMQRFGLLNGRPRPTRDAAGGARAAQRIAESGAVLLRNEHGALPLTGRAGRSIAVIGPTARVPLINGGGSSHVIPDSAAAPLDAIRARAGAGGQVGYAVGTDPDGVAVPASALTPATPIDTSVPAGKTLDYTGTLTVPETGDYRLGLETSGGTGTLTVDGTQLVTAGGFFGSSLIPTGDGLTNWPATTRLTAGAHRLTVTAAAPAGAAQRIRLAWSTPQIVRDDIAAAAVAAKRARTAVVFAYDEGTEGVDRSSLALPAHQDALISAVTAANPRTVVVLNTGSSITMPWLTRTAAVLDMYYPGEKGAEATARLLFGDASPSGKLSQTFPAAENQTPVAGDPRRFPGVNLQEDYSEGIYVGYRWYDKENVKPLFPFGYGLSYTTFAYRGLSVRRVRGGLEATVTVTNTGQRTGEEVAQVYVGPATGVSAPQAVRSLGGYQKVGLRPGESRRIRIKVDARQLSHWNTAGHGWTVGTGWRTVWAGSSAADLPLHTKVHV